MSARAIIEAEKALEAKEAALHQSEAWAALRHEEDKLHQYKALKKTIAASNKFH